MSVRFGQDSLTETKIRLATLAPKVAPVSPEKAESVSKQISDLAAQINAEARRAVGGRSVHFLA